MACRNSSLSWKDEGRKYRAQQLHHFSAEHCQIYSYSHHCYRDPQAGWTSERRWWDVMDGLGAGPGKIWVSSQVYANTGSLGQKDSLSKKWRQVDSWSINLLRLQHSSFGNSFYSGVFLLNDPSWTKLYLYFHVTLFYNVTSHQSPSVAGGVDIQTLTDSYRFNYFFRKIFRSTFST